MHRSFDEAAKWDASGLSSLLNGENAVTDWYKVNNEHAIPSPALLLYPDRIAENIRRMCAVFGGASRLRPHVKTHKLAQVVGLKLRAGITKFKAATIAEAEMVASAGGKDVLLAVQPVGPQVERLVLLARMYPRVAFSTVVDDPDPAAKLSLAAQQGNVHLGVYLDLDVGMHRTGIAVGSHAMELYRHIHTLPSLELRGLHAYDGHLHGVDRRQLEMRVQEAFEPVWEMREKLLQEGFPVGAVAAGGTPTSSILVQQAQRVSLERLSCLELGAGVTVLWDLGQQEVSPDLDFLHAALLLGRVISKPSTHRLCVDIGHKSTASEMPLPRLRILGLEDAVAVLHSEEHMVLESGQAAHYSVGSVVYAIPRHICPTMALHENAWCVRDGIAKEGWPILARARCLSI